MARLLVRVALVAAGSFAWPGLAEAHFHLDEPANWITQLENGDPQKTGPCGALMEMNKTYTASNAVTSFKAGDTVTIKLEETVMHPGHYRVALAVADRSELPADPQVTAGGMPNSACGTVPIMDPPVFPVLADGELKHTAALTGQQTITVKLPDDVECDKCTLQIIEFMSNHSAPCFYHHCADISITKDSGGAGGMSAGGMSAGGAPSAGMSAGGASASGAGGAGAVSSTGGMGGMTGQAGSPVVPSAGMPSVAGSTGAGGAGGSVMGTGGSTAPSLGGSGGTGAVASNAGSPAATGGTGTNPSAPAQDTDSESGCSTTPRKSSAPWVLAGLLGLAALRSRRRR
jgi:MYXO-CTERM domain-containing protein